MKQRILPFACLFLVACGSGTKSSPDSAVLDVEIFEEVSTSEDLLQELPEPELDQGGTLDPGVPVLPDIPPPPDSMCRFGSYTASILDAPFPSNALRDEQGFLDLALFPNRSNASLFGKYLNFIEKNFGAYSPNTSIYVTFDEPLNVDEFPTPEETLGENSPVQLVNVSPDSERYGERIPVHLMVWDRDNGKYLETNTMIVRPVWGMSMEHGATYALILNTDLQGGNGNGIQPNPDFLSALEANEGSDPAHALALGPLAAYLADESTTHGGNPACGTVFSVTRPRDELRQMRDFVVSISPDTHPDLPMVFNDLSHEKTTTYYDRYEGTYVTPNFQKGTIPYFVSGGTFEFEEDGTPIIQMNETIDVAIALPTSMEMPEEGWPVVIHAHGTGGDYLSHFTSNGANNSPVGRLAVHGIMGIGIDQPMHGTRCTGVACDNQEVLSFNFLNPSAARCNFRQGTLDTIFLAHMLRQGMSFSDKDGNEILLDPNRIFFFGHSHGGITGAMMAGVEPELDTYLLSGAGGGLAITIEQRKDISDYQNLFRDNLGLDHCYPWQMAQGSCELTSNHITLSLVQLLIDASDPINYASPWTTGEGLGHPQNILLTEGLQDEQTPPETTEALAIAARIPQAAPEAGPILGLELLGVSPVEFPTSETVEDSLGQKASSVLLQYPFSDHFAVFQATSGAFMVYQSYFRSAADTGVPLLQYVGP